MIARELEASGWVVLGRNLRLRHGEIDILARRGSILHVVEVRSRVGAGSGHPSETVGPRKRGRIAAALAALARQGRLPPHREIRFDVAAVVWDRPGASPRIEIFENAFDAIDLM